MIESQHFWAVLKSQRDFITQPKAVRFPYVRQGERSIQSAKGISKDAGSVKALSLGRGFG